MRGTQLLLSLLCVMGVMGQQRLIYHEDSKQWAEAQAYCREYHTDLVTIRNDAENNQVIEDSWLGLYRDNSSSNWKWSRGDEPLSYNNAWNKGEPVNWGHCVFKQKSDKGEWKSEGCYENNKFYCVNESLYLVREMKTWEEALVHCRSMEVKDPASYNNHSYDLASLITQEDHKVAQEMIQTADTDRVWTGLRHLGDRWMWVGGEELSYREKKNCTNSNFCGAMTKLNDTIYSRRTCQEKNNFLCYKRPAV